MENATDRYRAWSQFLTAIRSFFISIDYLEVTTPALVPAGAFEASLDCLQVSWRTGKAELNTSPEIAMKVALSETKSPIFQIAKCFRDDPDSPIHRREFSMLEYYEPYANYQHMIRRTKELFSFLSYKPLQFTELTVQEAFLAATAIDLGKTSVPGALRAAVEETKIIQMDGNDSDEDLYFKLLVEKVEPSFDPEKITILKNYPPEQAALASLSPGKKFAERFEFYFRGIELCNGCTELSNPEELLHRYALESKKREKRGLKPHPVPQLLIDALTTMPPTSGVAVGVDRLFHCFTGLPF